MKYVYLVWDLHEGYELIGVCGTEDAARQTLLQYLEDVMAPCDPDSYNPWAEEADAHGFVSIESFKDAIRNSDKFDDDLVVQVEKEKIIF